MAKENEQGKLPKNESTVTEPKKLPSDETASYWLSALVESADDAVISKTLDGTITGWNKAAEQIFGYTAEEIVGRSILTLIPATHYDEEREILARIQAGERIQHYETVGQTKNKKLINVSLTVSPIKDAHGKIIGASKIAREITHLKQTEKKLRASEERYRTLFNLIDEGFCIIQMIFDENEKPIDYRFLELNPMFIEQTGLTDAAQGKTMRELVPNHDESWFEIYGKVAMTGEPIRFENRAEALDRWFDLYAFRIDEPESRKVAVLFKNITERRRSEENLRKSDTRLRLALDIGETSAFEIDLLTDAVETDEIGREIYGFNVDEPLTFAKVQSRFHPADLERVLQSVAAALASEGSDEFEVEQRIVRTDGATRWIRVRGRAFFEGAGETRRAVTCLGTYIDITKQKEAEQERIRLLKQIESERSRLQYLFAEAPAFVATLRGPEHIFEITNQSYLQLIGHRDVIGKTVREALPEIETQGYLELLDKVFQTGKPYVGREIPALLQRAPHGELEKRFIDFVYQPIFEDNDAVSGIFVHGVDITDQVQAREDAKDANRAKDEFLATLSHELRTPLNAILGWSKMMNDSRLGEDGKLRALETIQRNARIQAQLIDDILDVSRIISGKMKLEIDRIEISSIVKAAIESVLPAAQAKEISLRETFDSGDTTISGDANRLQQVVWNLLSNAVKFTPKNGRIEIRLGQVESHLEIAVTDNGIGISPAVLPFIFDRFRQADSATTRQYGGLGLGLAIVRHLVEMHGGTIEAMSEGEGKGATFTVKLPLAALQSSATILELAEQTEKFQDDQTSLNCEPELEGVRVLIVEDDEDGRILIATILEKCGAQVTAVSSAAEGFARLREIRPDVLISDLAMPGEDGFSLIKKVRNLAPDEGGLTPAAALTAYARVEDRMRVLRAGFQIHLPKPVEPAELIAVIASLIKR